MMAKSEMKVKSPSKTERNKKSVQPIDQKMVETLDPNASQKQLETVESQAALVDKPQRTAEDQVDAPGEKNGEEEVDGGFQ